MKLKEPDSGFLLLKRSDFYTILKRTDKEQAEPGDYVKFPKNLFTWMTMSHRLSCPLKSNIKDELLPVGIISPIRH